MISSRSLAIATRMSTPAADRQAKPQLGLEIHCSDPSLSVIQRGNIIEISGTATGGWQSAGDIYGTQSSIFTTSDSPAAERPGHVVSYSIDEPQTAEQVARAFRKALNSDLTRTTASIIPPKDGSPTGRWKIVLLDISEPSPDATALSSHIEQAFADRGLSKEDLFALGKEYRALSKEERESVVVSVRLLANSAGYRKYQLEKLLTVFETIDMGLS